MVYTTGAPLAVVALEPGVDGLRTAAARAVRACRGGGTVAWALDASLPVPIEEQVRALAEGAVIGGYDARRWRSGEPPRGVERFVICGCRRAARARGGPRRARRALDQRRPRARRRAAERDLPGRARRARRGAPRAPHRDHRPHRGRARRTRRRRRQQPDRPAADRPAPRAARRAGCARLALVGKAVTFDTGGYFLKPQSDIVRQKADMAGGAAVVARSARSPSSGSRCRSPASCRPARTC